MLSKKKSYVNDAESVLTEVVSKLVFKISFQQFRH